MSRTERLFDLLQTLRGHRFPVTGSHLAKELGVSLRTLYRDIATLQGQGANIEGEPGLGYVLRPGFMLPPLMFTEEEIEALVLGSRWVSERADLQLSSAAKGALSKIASVLPQDLRTSLDTNSLMVGKSNHAEIEAIDLSNIRKAIRIEHKIQIQYLDLKGSRSERTIWPVALGYFDHVRMLAGWCELRQEFRHFRTDRISALTISPGRYPRRRQVLLKEWREADIFQRHRSPPQHLS
ncbi:Predicted DNA-binding transcriptional regulator YafY, contains an HTH and WYL domains [Pseudomonas saponiphila]|uniref:Predicted DNA-binding transcriptional regulator YafY, contains an HTH and WYL domains n=1 Tax=Pseudomonas saponiphila TaxID=556534 RepID=A0A1H4K9I2_9PSED|nr:YafY family protein [Pseudomonas saponiphila]SEB54602.1 Predicted DNA-binding transcriptional regulator YafY, contains an HTH and WYL domains [Pseudomonas saponiphila]